MLKFTKPHTRNEAGHLAILDWGIGGFGFYELFKSKYPESPVVYFSDAGFTPYGKVEKDVLQKRLLEIWVMLQKQYDVSHLVIACHAASSILYDELGKEPFENVTGIVQHALEQVRCSNSQNIGIIGGAGTIASEVYKVHLETKKRSVHQKVAQPLSAIIEAGIPDEKELFENINNILQTMKGKIDHLLLACTHYPAVSAQIQNFLPDVKLLDPALFMLNWVQENWPSFQHDSADIFITTGEIELALEAAIKGFGGDALCRLIEDKNHVTLDLSLNESLKK
jgi:glutamate racemase